MEQENTNRKKSTRPIFILPIMFILIGIGFCMIPIKLLFIGEKITGTIVDVRSKESTDDDGNVQTLYSPVIRYTCGGEKVTGSTSYFSSKRYTRNENITVLCNKSNPSEFTTYGSFFPLVFTLFGLIALVVQIFNIKNAKIVKKTDNLEKWDNIEELNFVEEPENTQSSELKPQKNLLQKNLSDIEFFKKFPSVHINNELGTAIIFLIFSIVFGYLIYYLLFGGEEREVGGAIFASIFELVFLCMFITKLGEFIEHTIAKRKIRIGNMTMIQAKVTGFQHTADVLDSSYFQILCSDGKSRFKSEETKGRIYKFSDIPLNYLEALKIIYDPKNPQKTLQELDSHPKRFWIPDQYEETSQWLVKQIAGGQDYKHAYGIFRGKRITVGDNINVYIDPNNRKLYLVDLSFLK